MRRCNCPASRTVAVIDGGWKVAILYHLQDGTHRFGELQHAVGDVSAKILAQQLRELEADGIVSRKIYPQVPPKVEYSLTRSGKTLLPVVEAMCRWGARRRG